MVIKKFYIFLFFLISFLFLTVNTNAQEGCDPVASNQTTCEDPFPIACKQQMPNAGNIKRWCCDTQDSCDLTKDATQEQISTTLVSNDVEAYPKIGFPCDDTENPEFHSLRPYQGAICGDANKASFCSNELKFIESFDMEGKGDCKKRGFEGTFDCNPNFKVKEHNLYVELTDSMFPILGNTEQVTNSQGGTEQFDDAQKVNEYVSWYLSGVNNKAEYGENTDEKVVDFSGPVQKLLPKLIQEATRVKTIEKATADSEPYVDEETLETVTEPLNHDQVVVCGKEDGFIGDLLGIGKTKPVPCYEGSEYRLSTWLEDLSDFNGLFNNIGTDIWNKRTPPLPWSDENGKPFESQEKYMKAYNEWKGRSCAIIPLVDLTLCIDNPFVANKWAELYQYIPLANTTDKGGVQRIVGVQFQESNGTAISGQDYDGDNLKSAPLSFAHTQEVKELSEALNTTYLPQGYESEKVTETTEKLKTNINSGSSFACTSLNVRTNPGDNLFPGDRAVGDTKEMIIPGITYNIDKVKCVETAPEYDCRGPKDNPVCKNWPGDLTCNAEVAIVIKTILRAPNLDDIFATTTADSGSTFRKIFPKVEEGAPVSCIADIPGVSGVTYTDAGSKSPNGGDVELSVKNYPEDGGGSDSELTFPHVGSIYEYFLNGIQTALRPKGYGEPLVNGDCKPGITCGELPENLTKATGACNLGGVSSRIGDIPEALKDIVSAAAETYKVSPNLILAMMYGEGAFNKPPYQKYDWTEDNVKDWATCVPIPNCTGPQTSIVTGLALNWSNYEKAVLPDLKKIDPSKTKLDGCNLMDEIFVIANMLRGAAGGGVDLAGKSCYGITMSSSIPTSCAWNDSQIETALRVYQLGSYWTPTSTTANVSCPYPGGCNCATLPGSCAAGGGIKAGCNKPGDSCEKNGSGGNTSHNACVFDVSKGK